VLPYTEVVAIADEIRQNTAERTGSVEDVILNLVGITVGLLLVWAVWRRD